MTTINTTDDLMRLLRENPDFRDAVRRELLTEELLALPRRFAEYTQGADNRMDGMDKRFDGVDARFDGVDARFDAVDARFDAVDARFDGVDARLDGIDARLDGVDARFDGIDARLDRITDDIGELKGVYLEVKLHNRGVSYVATLLRARNGKRVRVAEQDGNSAAFNQALQEAEDRGILSEQEYGRLLDTDMIVQCNRRGSTQDVYVAIEATYGVTNRDVVQVKDSERALRKVFPEAEVHPVLYFVNDLPEDIRAQCEAQDVRVIQVENLR